MDLKVTAKLRTEHRGIKKMNDCTQPIIANDNIRKWNKCSDKILAKNSVGRREWSKAGIISD